MRSPGLDPEIGAVEHDRLTRGVAHDHALERERAVAGERGRLRGIDDARLSVSDLGQPGRRGVAGPQSARGGGQRGDGVAGAEEQECERGEEHVREHAGMDRADADDEHREQAGAGEQAVQAAGARPGERVTTADPGELGVALGDPARLRRAGPAESQFGGPVDRFDEAGREIARGLAPGHDRCGQRSRR